MVFYFFLNAYMLNMTYERSTIKSENEAHNSMFTNSFFINDIISNERNNFFANDTVFASTLQNTYQDSCLWSFSMGMFVLFTFREILEFVLYCRHYLTDLENWSQVLLIVLTLALLCGAGFQIEVMVILLSTWELIILISHHLYYMSTCIEMF